MDSVWVVGVSILPVYDDSTKETKEDCAFDSVENWV